jgi:transcriptional regulator with XRE-family HTH domain
MEPTALAKLNNRRRARRPKQMVEGGGLGEWIKQKRAEQGINQRELASLAGMSRSYLCDIERGRGTQPSFEYLERIATALGAERTEILRVTGILDPAKDPQETSRERKLIAVFHALSERGQASLEAFARFLLSEEQHWVQPALIDDESRMTALERRPAQTGPTLFDGAGGTFSAN